MEIFEICVLQLESTDSATRNWYYQNLWYWYSFLAKTDWLNIVFGAWALCNEVVETGYGIKWILLF